MSGKSGSCNRSFQALISVAAEQQLCDVQVVERVGLKRENPHSI